MAAATKMQMEPPDEILACHKVRVGGQDSGSFLDTQPKGVHVQAGSGVPTSG